MNGPAVYNAQDTALWPIVPHSITFDYPRIDIAQGRADIIYRWSLSVGGIVSLMLGYPQLAVLDRPADGLKATLQHGSLPPVLFKR